MAHVPTMIATIDVNGHAVQVTVIGEGARDPLRTLKAISHHVREIEQHAGAVRLPPAPKPQKEPEAPKPAYTLAELRAESKAGKFLYGACGSGSRPTQPTPSQQQQGKAVDATVRGVLTTCQCEHDCHFIGEAHRYGKALADVRPWRTTMGTFNKCAGCTKVCLSAYASMQPTPSQQQQAKAHANLDARIRQAERTLIAWGWTGKMLSSACDSHPYAEEYVDFLEQQVVAGEAANRAGIASMRAAT